MKTRSTPHPQRSPGFVLIGSLLFLLVITILALSMYGSFTVDSKIGANVREKHRALLAAESAQNYAEWWLTDSSTAPAVGPCLNVLNANAGQSVVCSSPISTAVTDVTAIPWVLGGTNNVGISYTPPNMTVSGAGSTPTLGSYYNAPGFYVSYVGTAPDGIGTVYQIDAYGYGGSPDAVVEVESTYELVSTVRNGGGL